MLCSSGREIRDVSSRLRLALDTRGKHRRAAEKRHDLPPPHRITSSVSAVVRPRRS